MQPDVLRAGHSGFGHRTLPAQTRRQRSIIPPLPAEAEVSSAPIGGDPGGPTRSVCFSRKLLNKTADAYRLARVFSLDLLHRLSADPLAACIGPSQGENWMMNTQGALQEARQLRTKIQMDSRLRLEVLAALSRTFRENGERVSNDLLRSLVFAVPEELPGEGALGKKANGNNGSGRSKKYAKSGRQMQDTHIPPGPAVHIPPGPAVHIPPGPALHIPPGPALPYRQDTHIPPGPAIPRRPSPPPEPAVSMRQKSAASSLRAGTGRPRKITKRSSGTKRSATTK